jgi:hypothetical protein
MNDFLEACYCWIRPEKDVSKNELEEETILNEELRNHSWCAGCFNFIENLSDFVKISKIGSRHYGFCCEDCYENWLSQPASQNLAPISAKLVAIYMQDKKK